MIYSAPGAPIEAVAQAFSSGLAGTVGVRIRDNVGNDSLARTTAGVVEDIASSGIYRVTLVAPSAAGQYSIVWDDGSGNYATEDLVVTSNAPVYASGANLIDWVTTQELKDQLEIAGTGRDTTITAAITAASRSLNRRSRREVTPQSSGITRTFSVPVRASKGDMLTLDLAPFDLRVATTVKLHPEQATPTVLTANTDYTLWPVGGRRTTNTYTQLRLSYYITSLWSTFADRFGVVQYQVVGDWGIWDTASVPEDIKRACILTAGSWIDKAIAEYGTDFAGQPRAMQTSIYDGYAVPRAALNILASAGLLPSPIV
jgi:hypothetical protein